MKINTQELYGAIQPRTTLKQSDIPAGRFDDLLDKAMNTQGGQVSAPGTLPPLQSLSSLHFANPLGADRSEAVGRINALLKVLESYEAKMGDPKASLKEIYPLVQQMEKMTAEMLPAAETMPEGDKLKEIINRLLVTATVETIKFNRGDYV